jgi:hypothetical protein
VWFVSPQPQPGRAPVEASTGAAAAGALLTLAVVTVLLVVGALLIASFAVAIPAAFSVATDDACSGNATVGVVAVSSAETEALVGDANPSLVAAPAACARSTTTAKTAAVSQIARWFMHGSSPSPKAQVYSP